MKQKKIVLFLSLMLSLSLTNIHAQSILMVNEIDGKQTSYTIEDIRKLTFLNEALFVNHMNESVQSYPLENIRSLKFSYSTGSMNKLVFQGDENIRLYPNPVVDNLTIDFDSANKGSMQINLFDLQGQNVFAKTVNLSENENKIQINVSSLPEGMYICRLINGLTIETSKFLKTN